MKINWAKGFTLIELLIVIAVLGILAGGVVVVIDPIGKINSAKLAKVKTFSASVENALIMSQVGKWSFEESSSPSKDTSGYTNDGVWNGGVAWQDAATCGLGFGGCLSFDGADAYVDMGDVLDLNGTNFTISVWAKYRTCTNGWHSMVNKLIAGTDGYQVTIRPAGADIRPYLTFGNIPPTADGFGNTILQANRWYHFAITYGHTTLTLYVDGVVDKTFPLGGVAANTDTLRIGTGDLISWQAFDGFIDEVRIYNQALLSFQVQQLYAQGLLKHQLAFK